jgi:mediator of replication checkpoint protein 1
MLRRKRGAGGFDDLDDDDDELAERRRRKQEEFARMRRALLEDEKIGKIAQNPKQQAFFHALEDRDEMDGVDYLDELDQAGQNAVPDSQAEETVEAPKVAASASASPESQKRKLPSEFSLSESKENVPPPRHPKRRTTHDISSTKPTSLADIRKSLSYLCEENNIIPDSQASSLSDSDSDSDLEITPDMSLSRVNTSDPTTRSRTSAVVNRLNRAPTTDDDAARPMAFQSGGSGGSTFKVPSLLRRATNLSTVSGSSSSTGGGSSTTSVEKAGGGGGGGVRIGGTKKSNFHYQAREAERRRVVDAAEVRRKAMVKRTVMSVKGSSILGLLRKGSGGFE